VGSLAGQDEVVEDKLANLSCEDNIYYVTKNEGQTKEGVMKLRKISYQYKNDCHSERGQEIGERRRETEKNMYIWDH
jgi:hypothetical protein